MFFTFSASHLILPQILNNRTAMSCPQTSPCKMAAPPEHANAACKSAVKTAVCKLAQREGAAEEVKPGSRIDLVAEIHP